MLDNGVVVAIASGLLTAAATYGALSSRLTRAEKDIESITAKLEATMSAIGASREKQGERLGAVEDRTATLEGQCQVMLKIFGEESDRLRRKPSPTSSG